MRGAVGHEHRRRLRKRHALGDWDDTLVGHRALLRVAPVRDAPDGVVSRAQACACSTGAAACSAGRPTHTGDAARRRTGRGGTQQLLSVPLTLDAFPDRLDDASDFGPRRELALRLKLILALDDEEVREVDGGGLDLQDNLHAEGRGGGAQRRSGICGQEYARAGGAVCRGLSTEEGWEDTLARKRARTRASGRGALACGALCAQDATDLALLRREARQLLDGQRPGFERGRREEFRAHHSAVRARARCAFCGRCRQHCDASEHLLQLGADADASDPNAARTRDVSVESRDSAAGEDEAPHQ